MPVPWKAIWSGIKAAAPIAAPILGATLERRWARKDSERRDQYNSPANQIKLLKEAGLPAAAYFSAGMGSQSQGPRETSSQTEGVMDSYFMNRIRRKELMLMDATIDKTRAEADEAMGRTQFLLGTGPNLLNPQQQGLDADVQRRKGEAEAIEISNEIKSRTKEPNIEMVFKELDKLKTTNEAVQLLLDDSKLTLQFRRDLANALDTEDFWQIVKSYLKSKIMDTTKFDFKWR